MTVELSRPEIDMDKVTSRCKALRDMAMSKAEVDYGSGKFRGYQQCLEDLGLWDDVNVAMGAYGGE
jgi:hypothetical protein